jgi:hypothetical protein
VTEVTPKTTAGVRFWPVVVLCLATAVLAQNTRSLAPTAKYQTPDPSKPAEQLYLQLRSVGLDASRVFAVRDASIDREQLHITLEDGTIAFTQDVLGKVTGAIFQGEGEVLLAPPDLADRASMSMFTGAAILEERFETAYFRFNDESMADLQPLLRPLATGQDSTAKDAIAKEVIAKFDESARRLAEADALRLLLTFSRLLPPQGPNTSNAGPPATSEHPTDRFLHARIQGDKLGGFDVFYDTLSPDRISAAQLRVVEDAGYYDYLAAFTPRKLSAADSSGDDSNDDLAIRKYQIRAEVRPPTQLSADARLQVEVLRTGQRAVLFELSRFLAVNKVEVDGQPVEYIQNQALEGTQLARRGNDVLAVLFPRALRAGQKMELHFTYAGDVLSEAGSGLLYVGARGTWYPNRGLAAADFDLQFQYPPGWTLLATGKRTSYSERAEKADAPAQQTSQWLSDRPMPVAGFNLGRYNKVEVEAGSVVVDTYAAAGVEKNFPQGREEAIPPIRPPARHLPGRMIPEPSPPAPPPSPAHNAKAVADQAARAVEFYARRFGPYPYNSLALTQMPGPVSQGWPGLVFLSSYAFLSRDDLAHLHMSAANIVLDRQVTAHEIAHQWWGDLVYWSGYRDQWLVEGLANYCSLMMLETENPADFRLVMDSYRQDLLRKNRDGAVLKDAGPVTLGLRLSSSQFPDGYEVIGYGRGTWLFHMLRTMLQDAEGLEAKQGRSTQSADNAEPFMRALRKVRERYAGKAITTRQLIAVFAEELPEPLRYEGRKSLDWFYQGWINGTAVPHLELQGVKLSPGPKSVIVNGTILQKSAPKDLVTSVPLYALMPGNRKILVARVFADGVETNFRVSAPLGLRRIVLDPEQTVLSNPH